LFEVENINIEFTENTIYLLSGVIFLISYSLYVYKYTIPGIKPFKKFVLVFFRFCALLIIFLVIFQPVINYTKPEFRKQKNYVFFDNSKSIQFVDSSIINSLQTDLNQFLQNPEVKTDIYTFSDSINNFKLKQTTFSGKSTNFENLFDFLNSRNKNISTFTIISDGNVNSGRLSEEKIEKLNIPIFTLGLGKIDNSADLLVKKINYNSFIYSNVKTQIESVIESDLTGINVNVSMLIDGKLKKTKNVLLSQKLTSVSFNFFSGSPGKKRIGFRVTKLENEKNIENNYNSAIINVLSNKIRVGLISGSLSNDYRFIKNILKNDDKNKLAEFIKVNADIIRGNISQLKKCDVLFLIGFPSLINSASEIKKIKKIIIQNKIPFFFIPGNGVNFKKLKNLSSLLQFDFKINTPVKYNLATVKIKNFNSPLIKTNEINPAQVWKNLPPIMQPEIKFTPHKGTDIIAVDETMKTPLLISGNIGKIKSVYVLANNIWKWQLNNSGKTNILKNFISSVVKWLVADDELKNIVIKTDKTIYNTGELITFSAKVYSETFEPINDAVVEVTVNNNEASHKLVLNHYKNGNYTSQAKFTKPGKYKYKANVFRNSKSLSNKKGLFEISSTDIEFLKTGLNREYLERLSIKSGGKYFSDNELQILLEKIKTINRKNKISTDKAYSFSLHLDKYILFIIIFMFTIEWIFRKYWKLL